MPKLGMEPIRRASLIKATIDEIGKAGSLDVTVSQIAKRAGMSSALAHHYFGGKEQIFLAAMRHTLSVYGGEVRGALLMARSPSERVEAIVRSSFSHTNFRREVVAAWLNFYVLAQSSDEARRLLIIYQKRLRANLRHALRPAYGAQAPDMAERLAALIDGAYLRQSLGQGEQDAEAAIHLALGCLPKPSNTALSASF
ncbi:transcriptional regulator BetI [Thalassobius vesicularis]|uniref:HTH-type transcriptional regulator BetI n=1 Tax=Thalassobius vesicularis TaxID=1294297 RepID=A0A4S3MB34_9RHOB|nr:transcriptional regulator BetI [Thalassobius vesicularis]THD75823.1 transcriptional regulator BetI [Thalassobius vesicularis]